MLHLQSSLQVHTQFRRQKHHQDTTLTLLSTQLLLAQQVLLQFQLTVIQATVNQVEVPDYPVTVPSTGGMGTMMFYVGGAALIACAGVLLFVLKRKKAAK